MPEDTKKSKLNPRYANRALREKNRARFRRMGLPCHICGQPIRYDEPSDHLHPFSFVIDEIIPVSRWKEFGYPSPRAVAEDWNNLAPAHYVCNARKGNKIKSDPKYRRAVMMNISDGNW